jgi:YesN/AraC family two-component response regulator
MARIILIDDDDPVRAILARTLSHFGHTVIEARDGKEGLDIFPRSSADLVITDIVMPEMEGLQVVMELRKILPAVKIIAISGGGRHSPADFLRIALHLGASKVLTKPFSNEELIKAVNDLLLPSGSMPPHSPG